MEKNKALNLYQNTQVINMNPEILLKKKTMEKCTQIQIQANVSLRMPELMKQSVLHGLWEPMDLQKAKAEFHTK